MTDTAASRQEQALVNSSSSNRNGNRTNKGAHRTNSHTHKVMQNSHINGAARNSGSSLGSNNKVAPPMSSSNMAQNQIGTKPTLVEKAPMRFLIMDAPRQANLPYYIREMKRHNVTHVVRVCEPTYLAGSEFSNAGICLHEMEYKDGTSPSKDLILAWLKLVDSTFYSTNLGSSSNAGGNANSKNYNKAASGSVQSSASGNGGGGSPCIAVHCVAGLGRAPVMVAIALIEFAGMDPVEAVSLLRTKRRGAINEKQLLYLSEYKKMYKAPMGSDSACACLIL